MKQTGWLFNIVPIVVAISLLLIAIGTIFSLFGKAKYSPAIEKLINNNIEMVDKNVDEIKKGLKKSKELLNKNFEFIEKQQKLIEKLEKKTGIRTKEVKELRNEIDKHKRNLDLFKLVD